MALKHPAETPTKNLPETPPKTPKNDPWTDHPGTQDGPTPEPGMGPSRVQGGPVPGPGVVGPGVDFGGFWGVSLGGFLWAFRPGVLVPLFGFFFF